MKCLENTWLQQLLTSSCIMYNLLWNEKLVQKVHTVPKTLLLLEVSWEYTIVGTKSSHCAQNFTFTWSVLRIHNCRYKKFTLYFNLKCLENTRLQQLLTSSCIMYNLFWNEKPVQKVHTVPKTLLLLEASWEYTIVGTKSSHCAQNFTFTWSVLRIHNCRYKKFTLYFYLKCLENTLYFYLKCLENTRLQQLLTSSCIMYNLFQGVRSVKQCKCHVKCQTICQIIEFCVLN